MNQAVRAIIINNDKMLVMLRVKQGSRYFTLIGGGVKEGETLDQALIREVKEETGLDVIQHELVFKEENVQPYANQFIYLCQLDTYDNVALGEFSEEAILNKYGMNTHQPMWVNISSFKSLAFRTPQLQNEILKALKGKFPSSPKTI